MKKKVHDEKIRSEEKYMKESKERLKKILTTKIRTTMIAALDTFEKKFGELWNHGSRAQTQQEQMLREIYEETRKHILDVGNDQIRNMEKELEDYNIKWKRHHVKMPIVSDLKEYQKLRKEHYERIDSQE